MLDVVLKVLTFLVGIQFSTQFQDDGRGGLIASFCFKY